MQYRIGFLLIAVLLSGCAPMTPQEREQMQLHNEITNFSRQTMTHNTWHDGGGVWIGQTYYQNSTFR